MKSEEQIRAYILELKKEEEMAKEVFRSSDTNDKRKEHLFEMIQYFQRARNALE